ncbi:hypothetical protein FO519_008696 [Halicephalobus sp. NKZ332]|nr:hypothetical protein FO519_008696 [Halicephalobus sp. NKZ332]
MNSSDSNSIADDDSGCALSRRPSVGANGMNNNGERMNHSGHMAKVSSVGSFESFDQDAYLSDAALSDDLDKLSTCLTEVSDESEDKKSGLIQDLVQAELAFWTLIFSFIYSYAWLQHRKKFLLSVFVAIPLVLIVCITIAWLLGIIVVLSRMFSTGLKIEQMLKFGQADSEEVIKRRRSLSNASRRSSVSFSGRSSSCEELPKPVCRKHSTSTNSLNQIHISTSSYCNGSEAASPVSGRRTPTSPIFRKHSYAFTHQTADDEDFD